MKTEKYIARLKAAIKKYFEEIDLIESERIELDKEKKDYSQSYLDSKAKDFQAREIVIKDMTLEKVQALKEEFFQAVDAWETPRGEMLDTEDLKLLQGYLTLSEKEVQALGEKHKDNAIMLRALKEYAVKNDLHFYLKHDGNDIKAAYNLIHTTVERGINKPNEYSGTLIKSEKYFNDMVSKQKALTYNE